MKAAKWIYEHSPWVTGANATYAVASVPIDPHATNNVVAVINGAAVPVLAFAFHYFLVNTLPKVQAAWIRWQEAKEKHRAGSFAGQLAAIQVALESALGTIAAKDELVKQLHTQLAEERKLAVEKFAELAKQIDAANEKVAAKLERNYEAIKEAK